MVWHTTTSEHPHGDATRRRGVRSWRSQARFFCAVRTSRFATVVCWFVGCWIWLVVISGFPRHAPPLGPPKTAKPGRSLIRATAPGWRCCVGEPPRPRFGKRTHAPFSRRTCRREHQKKVPGGGWTREWLGCTAIRRRVSPRGAWRAATRAGACGREGDFGFGALSNFSFFPRGKKRSLHKHKTSYNYHYYRENPR